MERVVLHVDLDQFIVAVELLRRPELRGRPVLVGGTGDPTRRGVVAGSSYEARTCGVRSGTPLRTAAARCPDAVFLPLDRDAYLAASARFMAALTTVPAVLEPAGWDEAFLLADTGDAERTAREVQALVRRAAGLDCSVGIGGNKLQAKLASGLAKPAGVFRLDAGNWAAVMADRAPDALWGIGRKTAARLARLGVATVRDLAEADESRLAAEFGPRTGPWLRSVARGEDESPVVAGPRPARSHGRELTFERDVADPGTLRGEIRRLARQVAGDLAVRGERARRVVVKIRWAPFTTHTHGVRVDPPNAAAGVIERAAVDAFAAFDPPAPVRLVGVRAEVSDPRRLHERGGTAERPPPGRPPPGDPPPPADPPSPAGPPPGAPFPPDDLLEIDGSRYSGSGSIVRQSVAYSALTGRPVRITSVRARRPRPGLRPQHLSAVEAIRDLDGGELEGAHVGSRTLAFRPAGRPPTGRHAWDIGTAGSATMLALAVLPLAAARGQGVDAEIRGGLFQDFAPSPFHLQQVVLPLLARMGVAARVELVRPGYVPTGQGVIRLHVPPAAMPPRPLVLRRHGTPRSAWGVALASHLSDRGVAARMAAAARAVLGSAGISAAIEERDDRTAAQPGAAFALFAEFAGGALLGADRAGAPRRRAEQIGAGVARQLLDEIASGACLDRHACDQILPFAAMAGGESRFTVPTLTEHLRTGGWLASLFLGAALTVADGAVTVRGGRLPSPWPAPTPPASDERTPAGPASRRPRASRS